MLAQEGCPVAEINALQWAAAESFLRRDPESLRVYLPAGRPPRMGEVFRNPDLAESLRHIAAEGRDGFYRGAIARRIASGLEQRGGALTTGDLSDYDAEWVEPLSIPYREWQVSELPPNGQGIAALMMLNLLEGFPIADFGHNSSEALHALIEAKKLAYADLARHVADPAFSHVPVNELLSKDYAARRRREIDPQRAAAHASHGGLATEGGDTTYLSAIDRDGNLVSLIQSNFASFGSGIAAEGTGFALQNRGALFTLDPRHPNALAPRKRPLHTIIPGFMARPGTRIAFGIMGGWNQAQAHAQFVSNIVDHGMNIQAALEAPRATKHTFAGCDVMVESRVPSSVRLALAQRGHEVEVLGAYSNLVGGGQCVLRHGNVNYGASDPRKDGAAIPEPHDRRGSVP
jgi:gamma-glutamyltranspeptidase/glutathione hydrolase